MSRIVTKRIDLYPNIRHRWTCTEKIVPVIVANIQRNRIEILNIKTIFNNFIFVIFIKLPETTVTAAVIGVKVV